MNGITKIGCVLLILQDNKLLLGKRKNCFGAGTWGLPGGHLEFNERFVDAAIREAKEEIGLQLTSTDLELSAINDLPLTDIQVTAGLERHIQIAFVYNGKAVEPMLMEPEHCEVWEFFSLDNFPEVFSSHIHVVELFKHKRLYG